MTDSNSADKSANTHNHQSQDQNQDLRYWMCNECLHISLESTNVKSDTVFICEQCGNDQNRNNTITGYNRDWMVEDSDEDAFRVYEVQEFNGKRWDSVLKTDYRERAVPYGIQHSQDGWEGKLTRVFHEDDGTVYMFWNGAIIVEAVVQGGDIEKSASFASEAVNRYGPTKDELQSIYNQVAVARYAFANNYHDSGWEILNDLSKSANNDPSNSFDYGDGQ